MPYEGLQTEVEKPSLAVTNLIEGSIHGRKVFTGTDTGIPGIPFELLDMNGNVLATAITDDNGEFHFEDLDPGAANELGMIYTVREVPTPAVMDVSNPVSMLIRSGEEYVAFVGQAGVFGDPGSLLDAGQFEVLAPNNKLLFQNTIAGSVHGTVFTDVGDPIPNFPVQITGPGGTFMTLTDADGEFDFPSVPASDYTVNVGDQSAVITIDQGEEEVGITGQGVIDPGQFETVNPDLNFVFDVSAPTITGIKVASTDWDPLFLELLDPGVARGYPVPTGIDPVTDPQQTLPLPWNNLDQIIFEFGEHVTGPGGAPLDISAFDVSGTIGPAYMSDPGITFSYDPATFIAVITFSVPIENDELTLMITANDVYDASGNLFDGQWIDDFSTESGDGVPGGDFIYALNVLPGDWSQDGFVLSNDASMIAGLQFEFINPGDGVPTTSYDPLADLNGDGFILSNDATFAASHQFDVLGVPSVAPGMRIVAPPASESTVEQTAGKLVLADASSNDAAAADTLFAGGLRVVSEDPAESLELLSDTDEWASAIDDFFGDN